jgi:hypothetical protein
MKGFKDSWTNGRGKWIFVFGIVIGVWFSIAWSLTDKAINITPLVFCLSPFVVITTINMMLYAKSKKDQ